jgi:anti-sigma B factor antagonist
VEIQQDTVGNAERLALSGDLDSFSVNNLRERINRLFDSGIYNIIIDLTNVKFVDSAGLGQLVAALKMAVHHGGDLVLVKPNDTVKDLLRITKLDTIFRRFDTAEGAASVFQS